MNQCRVGAQPCVDLVLGQSVGESLKVSADHRLSTCHNEDGASKIVQVGEQTEQHLGCEFIRCRFGCDANVAMCASQVAAMRQLQMRDEGAA